MDLRVRYYRDEDTGHWGFVVPRLHFGGGASTRAEAEDQAREAILFTLEDDDEEPTAADDEEPAAAGQDVGYFRVTIEKAS